MKRIHMIYMDEYKFVGAPGQKNMFAYSLHIFREKFKVPDDDCIVILEGGVESIDWHREVVKFIKQNKIKKVWFIIEDVFRLYSRNEPLANVEIFDERLMNPDWRSIELDLIGAVIRLTQVDCRVFSGEKHPRILELRHKLKIEYFDLFLLHYNFIQRQRQQPKIQHKFTYKATCFSNRYESHRQVISTLLHTRKDVLLTYNEHYKKKLDEDLGLKLRDFDEDIRKKLFILEPKFKNFRQYYENGKLMRSAGYSDSTRASQMINSFEEQESTKKLIHLGFLNIAAETRMTTNMPYMSEKTLKPIQSHRPFIMLAPQHSLRLAKEYGFKTFSRWWDEEYDEIGDHTQRFQAAYRSIEKILKSDMKTLRRLYEEMKPVLEHNYKQLGVLR